MERLQDMLEALEFGAKVINLGGKILEDGKITIGDITSNFGDIIALPGFASRAWAGRENIRIADLKDAADRAYVLARFKEYIDLPKSSELAEDAIEEGANAILAVIGFAHKIAALRAQE